MHHRRVSNSIEERAAAVTDATDRLLAALTDVDTSAASLLPDWTVGHVLTHVARNADGQRNLLHWAVSGEPTPMYPTRDQRNADIEAGASRAADDIVTDLHLTADLLAAAIGDLPSSAWQFPINTGRAADVPAEVVLSQRLAEVELHHHDLGVDAGLALLDAAAGRALLAAVLHSYVRTRVGSDIDGLRLIPDGEPPVTIGPDDDGVTLVRGPATSLAGWLAGRTDGADLACDGPLPDLPPW